MHRPAPRRGEAGFALLAAVIFLGMLLLLTAVIVMTTGVARRVSHGAVVRSRAQALGDAIVFQVAQGLHDARGDHRPRIDGTSSRMTVLGAEILLSVDSEFGKVDLNAAPTDVLARLFAYAGLRQSEAQSLAVSVEHARSQTAAPVEGSDRAQAPQLHFTFRLANELLYLPGLSRALVAALDQAVTTDSGHDTIDTSTAPVGALVANAGIPPEQAKELVRERSSAWGAGQGGGFGGGDGARAAADLRGWPFRIKAQYTLDHETFEIDTVIRLVGAVGNGFVVSHYHFSEVERR